MRNLYRIIFCLINVVLLTNVNTKAQTLSVKNIGSYPVTDSLVGSNLYAGGRTPTTDVHTSSGLVIFTYTEPDNPLAPSGDRNIYCRIYDRNMNTIIPAFRINQNTTGDQLYPMVKINQQNNTFVIAWASNHGSNGYDIYMKKLDINLSNPGDVVNQTEYLVNTNYVALGQIIPKLAFDYNYNELIVVWRDNDGQDGSGTGAYGRRVDYANFPSFIGNQFIINQTTADQQVIYDIEVSPITGALYALYGSVMGANAYDIYFRKWKRDASGNLVAGNETRANTTVSDWQWNGALTFNKTTGFFCIGWTSDYQDGSGRGLYFRVYNQYDVAQIAETRATIPTTNNQYNIKTMWDEASGYLVHFYMYSLSGFSTVKYQVFTPSYTTYGSETDAVGGANTSFLDDGFPISYNQNNKNLYLAYNMHTGFTAPSKVWNRYYRFSYSQLLSSDCSTDLDKVWVQETDYDEYGNIVAEKRTYLDNYGKPKQVQNKNVSDNIILATHNVYDNFGRKVIETLPAPISQNCFTYNANFITDNVGHSYTPAYFANPVANTVAGTLGYYYSNNNSAEPYVGTTGFPYSRTEFTDTIYGGAHVVSAPGDSLKYGAKHEQKTFTLPMLEELDYNYLPVRNNFVPNPSGASLKFQGVREVTVDQNQREVMTFKDKAGRLLTKSIAGTEVTKTRTVITDWYTAYVPAFTNGTVVFQVIGLDSVVVMKEQFLLPPNYARTASNLKVSNDGKITITGMLKDKEYYQFVSKKPFTIRYNNTVTTVTQPALRPGDYYFTYFDFYTKSSFSMTSVVANTKIKITSLSSGNVLYTGAMPSTFSIGRPDAIRLEVINPPTDIANTNTAGGGWPFQNEVTVTYKDCFTQYEGYYFYNDVGKLVASVAPKGINTASSAVPKFTTTYTSSTTGRTLTMNDPDTKLTTSVYRKDGKLRFKQNNNQKQTGKFTYINYDRYGRKTETGEYDPALDTSPNPWTFESQALTPSGAYSVLNLLENTDSTGGLGNSGRTSRSRIQYCKEDTGIPVVRTQRFVQGQVSKTYNDNAATWYSYDELGRIEWIVKSIYNYGSVGVTKAVTIDYTYDMRGNVLSTVYQKGNNSESFEHRYFFNLSQQMVLVQTKPAGQAYYQNEAKYKYYLPGALKRTELADSLQGIDYLYTVNGWLKSINHPTMDNTKDPGKDGYASAGNKNFGRDVFGIQFQYYDGDYARTGSNITNTALSATYKNYFNGMVKASRWEVRGHDFSGNMGMYAYTYDTRYQFTGSDFGTVANASEGTYTSSTKFKIQNLTYDLNGNILTKQMNNETGATYVDLVYNYDASGRTNRLATVYNSAVWNRGFLYDSSGFTNVEQNYYGNDVYLTYDVYGKVVEAYKKSGATKLLLAQYSYDEAGHMLRKAIYNVSLPTSTYLYTIWYVRDAVGNVVSTYDDNSMPATLAQREIQVYGLGRLGIAYKAGSTYSYSYELTDQLGNVRATIARTRSGADATILSWADYYADGRVMPTRSGVSSPPYRYGYQGQYCEVNLATGYFDFELRSYSMEFSRWLQPDPENEHWSPYLGMGNNPISVLDPTGGKTFFGKLLQGVGSVVKAVVAVSTAVTVAVTTTVANVATAPINAVVGFVKGFTSVGGSFGDKLENGVNKAGNDLGNSIKIEAGLFKGSPEQLESRFSTEIIQTLVGYNVAQTYNTLGLVKSVNYYDGATVIAANSNAMGGPGFTIGSFITGDETMIEANPDNWLFQHEYGHYLQSQASGPFYLSKYALPSLLSTEYYANNNPVEQDANIRALNYWQQKFGQDSNGNYNYQAWDNGQNWINQGSTVIPFKATDTLKAGLPRFFAGLVPGVIYSVVQMSK